MRFFSAFSISYQALKPNAIALPPPLLGDRIFTLYVGGFFLLS